MSHHPPTKYQSLTRRRGSASAHDPLAQHAGQYALGERQAMSRLTIVRVAPDDAAKLYGYGDGPPDGSPRGTRASLTPPHSPLMRASTGPRRGGGGGGGHSPRLSFASSSFAEPGSGSPPRSPKEPRRRFSGSGSGPAQRHVALTPEQVVELAASSVRPPVLQRRPSAPALLGSRREPMPAAPTISSPAKFIPVPDSQFLPFLDRPVEVAAFIGSPPTSRLMALLEQAFPAHLRIRRAPRDPSQPPPYTPSRAQSFADELAAALVAHAARPRAGFDGPETWSYATLLEWMCAVPRAAADDAEWVRRLRECVMVRSEQICVALLSALGVPMEGTDELRLSHADPIDDEDALASPRPTRAMSATPTRTRTPRERDIPHRGVVTSPPTVLEDAEGEDADAFQLSITAILPTPEKEEPQHARPWSRGSGSSGSGRMAAIGESEDEDEHAHELEVRGRRGSATARARSPAVAAASESDTDTDDESPYAELFGLTLCTMPRDAGDGVLPSPRVPGGALPVPVTSHKPPAARERVSHVLSGAPGHAGYTWRPGGPLFAPSFGGESDGEEEEKVPPMVPKCVFYLVFIVLLA
jgi:hypothetical protein